MPEPKPITPNTPAVHSDNDSQHKHPDILIEALPSSTSAKITHDPSIPSVSSAAVLGESTTMPKGTPICRGFDFNTTMSNSSEKQDKKKDDPLPSLLSSFATMGFQGTILSQAIEEIKKMRSWRLSDIPFEATNPFLPKVSDPAVRSKIRTRIFLSFTSNQISCGQREIIRFLVQHKMVDAIVTTAGGIEEDLIKCLAPTFIGDFKLDGKDLRKKGLNRIGNLIVPNSNYCKFEDWFFPILNTMHDEQEESWKKYRGSDDEEMRPFSWTPSAFINRIGKEIDHEDSVLYWAYKNDIPIFCPALTDGSIGDMLYFHSYKRAGFLLDINADIRKINDLAIQSFSTGMIILGGGIVKHHVCNANLMRNGADFSIMVNTAHEFDGSDAGASPDEAVSWGKIRAEAKPVKVCAEATIVFPFMVMETFAKDVDEWKKSVEGSVCWLENEDAEE